MDWIDDEVSRLSGEHAAKKTDEARQQTIASQCHALWDDLRFFIEKDVEKLGQTPEIRRRIGDVTFNGTNIHIVKVDKLVFPAVHITITKEI